MDNKELEKRLVLDLSGAIRRICFSLYMKLFFAFLVRNFYMKLESISEKASSHLYRLFVLTYGGPVIAIYSGLNNKYLVPSHFVMGPCVLGMHLAQGSIATPQFYRDVFMGLASLGLTPARPALG